MTNNWLIRYSNNKIEGPFPRETIIEKYNQNLFSVDDELSQNNGFWFWVKEVALIKYYLIEGNLQDVNNPFVETKIEDQDLQIERNSHNEKESKDRRSKAPPAPISPPLVNTANENNNELTNDITQLDISINDIKLDLETNEDNKKSSLDLNLEHVPSSFDLNNEDDFEIKKSDVATDELSKNNLSDKKDTKTSKSKIKKEYVLHAKRDDRFLYIIFVLIFIILFGIVYYYKYILNKPINFDDITKNISPISNAYGTVKKKKS